MVILSIMQEPPSKLKVTAVQVALVFQNLEATLEKSVHIVEDTERKGAKLIVFPEFFACFPRYATFEPPEITRKRYFTLFKNSVRIPVREVGLLYRAARQNEIILMMGTH